MNFFAVLLLFGFEGVWGDNKTDHENNELTKFFEKIFRDSADFQKGSNMLKSNDFKKGWNKFRTVNKKSYKNKKDETERMTIFAQNLKKINEHNKNFLKKTVGFRMGLSEYADFTLDEYSKLSNDEVGLVQRYINNLPLYSFRPPWSDVPKNVDWRVRGGISVPRDKGSCASCWAFAAATALEGQLFQKLSQFTRLSPQNLVDCSLAYGTHGCKGGSPLYSFAYINDYGLVSEDAYPYTGKQNTCGFNTKDIKVYVSGVVMIEKGNEEHLKLAVGKVGPVITFIDSKVLQFYDSGIINDPKCSKKANHAVVIIGYGTDKDGDYWLAQNCVTNKGGYLKIARNNDNQCGIGMNSYYPVIA